MRKVKWMKAVKAVPEDVYKRQALNRAYESEYDLAERPMEGRLTDGNGNLLYQTCLLYTSCS